MKLEYSGSDQIPLSVDTVWAFITDPNKVAHALPDVLEVKVQDPTHFEAIVKVGVGPVRGKFKFKGELQPDSASRRLTVKTTGGGLGSTVDLTATAQLVAAGDDSTTLSWTGEAEMRGPVAAVGGRVLDAQAQKLISQTFANIRERLSSVGKST